MDSKYSLQAGERGNITLHSPEHGYTTTSLCFTCIETM